MAVGEADYGITQMAMTHGQQNWGPQPGDEGLLVRFESRSHPDPIRSREEGRPMFKDVDFIDIRAPGDRTNQILRPASERDKERFPKHYEAYVARREAPDEGTPLTEWPPITRSMVEQLAYLHIKTVEQLASVSDTHVGGMMGLTNLRELAKAFIAAAKSDAPLAEMREELNARDAVIARQEQLIREMDERLNALEGPVEVKADEEAAVSTPYKSVLDGAEEAPGPAAVTTSKTRRKRV